MTVKIRWRKQINKASCPISFNQLIKAQKNCTIVPVLVSITVPFWEIRSFCLCYHFIPPPSPLKAPSWFSQCFRSTTLTYSYPGPSQIKKLGQIFFKDFRDIAHWCEKIWNLTSSVIRQNGESQDRCYKKTKEPQFSQKRTFLTLWCARARVRIRGQEIFVFRKIWRDLFSCNTRFQIRPFAILPTTFLR